jgi:hypothetical protein
MLAMYEENKVAGFGQLKHLHIMNFKITGLSNSVQANCMDHDSMSTHAQTVLSSVTFRSRHAETRRSSCSVSTG